MAKYVWTAKNKFGNSVVRDISANTIEESKAALLAEGCTDLVLKGDEIMDAATAGMPRTVKFLGEEHKITEAEKLKHSGNPAPTFFSALWQGIARTKGFVILIFVLAAFEIYRGHMTSLIFLGLGLIAWLAFLIGVRLPSIYYHRLHKAADWSRWTEVLGIVDKLKKIEKFHFTKIPPPELGKYRAKALAGLGQLPQALAEFSQYENQPGCPSWLYKSQVAGIYDTVKQRDKALEYALQSIREKPTPVLYLDLANRYVRYKSDPVKAREALAEAEKSTLPDLAKPFQLRCRGILALLEKDYNTARRELEASLEIMQKTPHIPFRDGHISVAKAYLCCVRAVQGDQGTARKNFMEAEEYLVATGETELLEQCKKAMETYNNSGLVQPVEGSLKEAIKPNAVANKKGIPATENILALRTDFSDEPDWKALCETIQDPEAEFTANVDFVSDPKYDGFTPDQLASLLSGDSSRTFAFIIDRMALTHSDHPILVVDLHDDPSRTFRVIPSEMWSVENNLSVGNMSFDEFANAVDQEGIFRGFPNQ